MSTSFKKPGQHRLSGELRCGWRCEQGSAAVEFTAVSVMLCALLLGILQFAYALHVRNTLVDAAAEGARYAALSGSGSNAGADRVFESINRAIGRGYVDRLEVNSELLHGIPAVKVTVRGKIPLVGFWGPSGAFEAVGHAIREDTLG